MLWIVNSHFDARLPGGLAEDRCNAFDAAYKLFAREGLRFARHLRGDIWEVRVEAESKAFRVLFSPEAKFQRVLLALEAFTKKSQKTPARTIELAERRLSDWRSRGRGAKR